MPVGGASRTVTSTETATGATGVSSGASATVTIGLSATGTVGAVQQAEMGGGESEWMNHRKRRLQEDEEEVALMYALLDA